MNKPEEKYKFALSEFEQFFKENFHAATLIAYRYLDDPSVVEDIVQESFVILWEKKSAIFQGKDEFRKYLFVTVRNRTISYLRSIKIKNVDIESFLKEFEGFQDEKLYDDEELAIKVSKAIKKLPRKCKGIFMLAYIENLTYNEIAERLSISKNTVKTQMGIAYRILREELEEVYFGLLFFILGKRIDW